MLRCAPCSTLNSKLKAISNNPLQTQNNYDSRRSSMSSAASSTSWANTRTQTGRLLYAPVIMVDEAGGTQNIWSDTNGSTSLPSAARPGWHTTQGVSLSQRQQAYATLRVPSQQGPGYMEKGSADSLVESVSTAALSLNVTGSLCCTSPHCYLTSVSFRFTVLHFSPNYKYNTVLCF